MNYYPDAWVIVRITSEGKHIDKVLAGWYGGYLNGDSWKLNSGVQQIVESMRGYEVYGYSGSAYVCHKATERMTSLTSSMLASFVKDLGGRATIEVVPISSILEEYKEARA